MSDKTLLVLCDSSAIHSFISSNCVTILQLPISELPYDLLVSTPTNKPIRPSQICMNIPFQIKGRTFVANLICLMLYGLNMILGMDWLSANRAMLNCSNKTVIFSPIPFFLIYDPCESLPKLFI